MEHIKNPNILPSKSYEERELIDITQSLEREHFLYEFPTRARLEALSYLDNVNKYSAFDTSSFLSPQDPLSPLPNTIADDDSLSPLQLPTLAQPRDNLENNFVPPANASTFLLGETEDCINSQPITKTILVCLNKRVNTISYPSGVSDEGYDDVEDDKELESEDCFYPIISDKDIAQEEAAVKIQSLWRGFVARRHNRQPLAFQLVSLCGTIHKRQMTCFRRKVSDLEKRVKKMSKLEKKVAELEQRLEEETALRKAFENTVEDLTVLIDRQQENITLRLEEEISLRVLYQTKMEECISRQISKEDYNRNRMDQILQQVEATNQQTKKEAESRKLLQANLDIVIKDISQLKNTDSKKKHATAVLPAKRIKTASGTTADKSTPIPNRRIPTKKTLIPRK
ncbi:hypothetical protein BY458DRAFT_337725 [Sporodiniella umbellata]|nr:hypothetical protein BY458DRAFT_337725 [Sporodiniella umbellata]